MGEDDNGKKPGGIETKDENKKEAPIASIKVEGKDIKVLDAVTTIEVRVLKLEDGREVSQVIAHEFMMTDHKVYMVRLLTDAIMTIMHARKRTPMIKMASQAMFNRLKRMGNKNKGGAFGGKK